MSERGVGLLSYALLGLLHGGPSSGYALRKVFALTPMSVFSDSPGAIYPALRRLVQRGLIRGRQEKSAGRRRREVFQLTAAGTRELQRWLALPPSRDEVMRRWEELALRLAFMDQVLGQKASVHFLKALEQELRAYLVSLHEYLESTSEQMPLSGRLAVEGGVRGYEARLAWTREALLAYQRVK